MDPSESDGDFGYTPENPWTPPKHPEGYDELGQEMAPDARIWRKYVEETDRVDKELVEGWNKTLDVILIFAALFSAISTAFVLESSKDLKQDYAQSSAQTLLTLSHTLSTIASGSPINGSVPATPDPDSFSPSASAVAVNVLWFLSLSLSVAVSLIAILAKEWCSHFMSGRVGPFLRQGRLRQQRWNEIERWKMKEILNVLPLLMHVALLLFAIGLSVYLWDINVHVALPVVITTSLAGLFYAVTVSLPLFFRFCPYTTALARFLYPRWLTLIDHARTKECVATVATLIAWLSDRSVLLKRSVQTCIRRSINQGALRDDLEASASWPPNKLKFNFYENKCKARGALDDWIDSMRGMFSTYRSQLYEPTTPMDMVTSLMISWMITNCEDPTAINMALQALAGASQSLPRRPLWECGSVQLIYRRTATCLDVLFASPGSTKLPHDRLLHDLSLYSRSHSSLTAFTEEGGLEILDPASGAKFKLHDDAELTDEMIGAAIDGRLFSTFLSRFILDCLWAGSAPRYDLCAFELNNIPTQAHITVWDEIESGRNQCPRQWELVNHVLSGCISNLPTAALIALVNGITKTYLYNSSQSPVPLLRLLRCVSKRSALYPTMLQAIGIGLTVASFSTGTFSMEWEQPATESVPDIEN